MEKLIKVRVMRPCYIEPENRPDLGKLYAVGEELSIEESKLSDFDKVTKGAKGHIVRGCMRRLDGDAAKAEPVTAAGKPAKGAKKNKPVQGSEEI